MADPLRGTLRPGESSEYYGNNGPTYREDYTEWGRWWDFTDFSRWTQEQKNEHQQLIDNHNLRAASQEKGRKES